MERHLSPGILDRRAHKAGQLMARLASRRAHAMGLGGRAVSKPPSSVTPKSSRQTSAVRRPLSLFLLLVRQDLRKRNIVIRADRGGVGTGLDGVSPKIGPLELTSELVS